MLVNSSNWEKILSFTECFSINDINAFLWYLVFSQFFLYLSANLPFLDENQDGFVCGHAEGAQPHNACTIKTEKT